MKVAAPIRLTDAFAPCVWAFRAAKRSQEEPGARRARGATAGSTAGSGRRSVKEAKPLRMGPSSQLGPRL